MDERNNPYVQAQWQPRQSNPAGSVMDQAQMLTPGGFRPLSKPERDEAARIALESGFSFDGYQVVRREFFSHKFDPCMTVKGNSIVFNNACITRLEEVVYVQVLINPDAKKLVIRPCGEGSRDAIRWCIAKAEKRKSREITCKPFAEKLHEMMGWETLYRYKLQGSKISFQGEELYLFDLTNGEYFLPAVRDSNNPKARPKPQPAQYPADWNGSFGLTEFDHTASVQVDLNEGFGLMDVTPQKPSTEQIPMEMIDQETGEVQKV